jgi:hypothetical protein
MEQGQTDRPETTTQAERDLGNSYQASDLEANP